VEKPQLDEKLFESVSKTIENLAFTEIFPTELEMPEAGKDYAVSLNVTEPCKGEFQLEISGELLYFIGEPIFARPKEEISEESRLDFLSELLNTIVGSFLSAALPGDTKFSLGLPQESAVDKSAATEQSIRWNFSAEETIFSLSASKGLVEYLQQI
jgi:hypothetical protein